MQTGENVGGLVKRGSKKCELQQPKHQKRDGKSASGTQLIKAVTGPFGVALVAIIARRCPDFCPKQSQCVGER